MTPVHYTDERYPICFQCRVFLYLASSNRQSCIGGFELHDGSFICGGCAERIPMKVTPLHIGEVMKEQTVQVEIVGIGQLKVRVWIAKQLFKIGAALVGCKIEIKGP